jgi:hypothetical protein
MWGAAARRDLIGFETNRSSSESRTAGNCNPPSLLRTKVSRPLWFVKTGGSSFVTWVMAEASSHSLRNSGVVVLYLRSLTQEFDSYPPASGSTANTLHLLRGEAHSP